MKQDGGGGAEGRHLKMAWGPLPHLVTGFALVYSDPPWSVGTELIAGLGHSAERPLTKSAHLESLVSGALPKLSFSTGLFGKPVYSSAKKVAFSLKIKGVSLSDRFNFNSHVHCLMESFSFPHPKTHPAETPENIDTVLCKYLIATQFTACLSENI